MSQSKSRTAKEKRGLRFLGIFQIAEKVISTNQVPMPIANG